MRALNPGKEINQLSRIQHEAEAFVCFLFCFGREGASAALCLFGEGAASRGGPPLACSPGMVGVTVCGPHQQMLRSSFGAGSRVLPVNASSERRGDANSDTAANPQHARHAGTVQKHSTSHVFLISNFILSDPFISQPWQTTLRNLSSPTQ